MTKDTVISLRNQLLARRREILDRVFQIQAGWNSLGEREIELEEEAQKASISEPYDVLDETAKLEIEQIDLALSKIPMGDYGICESCGDDIDVKRLDVLPAARLCVDCARDFERRHETLPRTTEIIGAARLPEEFEGFANERILRVIQDHFHADRRFNTDEMRISIRRGTLYLEGFLPSESSHQLMVHTLRDVLGFTSIVDRIEVNEQLWAREESSPGKRSGRKTEQSALPYDTERFPDEDWEVGRQDEAGYVPSDEAAPYGEESYGGR